MKPLHLFYTGFIMATTFSCKKGDGGGAIAPPVLPTSFSFSSLRINGSFNGFDYTGVNITPVVKVSFSAPIKRSSAATSFTFKNDAGAVVSFTPTFENNDSTVVLQPASALDYLTRYTVSANTTLQSAAGGKLLSAIDVKLYTSIDSSDKFPTITDAALLDKVQQQTFKYFWDFGHPTSGLARERNTSGDLVTSGGSGFGIMAILVAIERGFITRTEGLARIQKMAGFLKNTAQRFHGVYPHWLNGATGVVIPFSTKDNGADLVETSYLIQGLLCARQYFTGTSTAETAVRSDINAICDNVEWSWFRKGAENVLYWHWSPNYSWDMNLPIKGWNECLITYILAATSSSYAIPATVYQNGWAANGAIKNTTPAYGYTIPLGTPTGGPLFFSHYSFMGLDPRGLQDSYGKYDTQVVNHTKVNYNYCVANPQNNYGYSSSCWGLTASDIQNGYTASSPSNDVGVIAPTAALSSFPYTPVESMRALKFFYYKLGDKIWKDYGFTDAFSLKTPWFADSHLAIDQGPIIVMIENYRSGLLWKLFTSCPEVKSQLKNLGFTAPYL